MPNIEQLAPDTLWRYYQRGYHCMVRNGFFFRQVLRPALSHVFFQRAVPVFIEYAKANRGMGDIPPSLSEQLQSCPLSPRDLLHLDYAISLGLAEEQIEALTTAMQADSDVLAWPGPAIYGNFVAVDMPRSIDTTIFGDEEGSEEETEDEDDYEDDDTFDDDDEDTGSPPPTRFDL